MKPTIRHYFGDLENPKPAEIFDKYEMPRWKQVHGTDLAWVNQPNQECGQVDALICETPGIPIAVVTADCMPILLYREAKATRGAIVAAIHAGWRGLLNGIVPRVWSELSARGEHAAEWNAIIGPCIGSSPDCTDCYPVGDELLRSFSEQFVKTPREIFLKKSNSLNISALQQWVLRDLGFKRITSCALCTKCAKHAVIPSKFRFHSYRREGAGVRQYSAIVIENT